MDLTQVSRLQRNVESLPINDEKPELPASKVAFISCRSRLTIMLADGTRGSGEKECAMMGS